MDKKWYDVTGIIALHISVQATSEKEAEEKAQEILGNVYPEDLVKITEVLVREENAEV